LTGAGGIRDEPVRCRGRDRGHAAAAAAFARGPAANLDPYNEETARQAIRSLARIGDTAGVQTQFQRLRDALDEIDEEPSSETTSLAAQLQRRLSGNALGGGMNESGDGRGQRP
jgi:hypothetical protein